MHAALDSQAAVPLPRDQNRFMVREYFLRSKGDPTDEGSSEFVQSMASTWYGGTGYHTTGCGTVSDDTPLRMVARGSAPRPMPRAPRRRRWARALAIVLAVSGHAVAAWARRVVGAHSDQRRRPGWLTSRPSK
jgi:hypothetical protein